jgi:hypothetical protein
MHQDRALEANFQAIAAPMPREEPVTNAVHLASTANSKIVANVVPIL